MSRGQDGSCVVSHLFQLRLRCLGHYGCVVRVGWEAICGRCTSTRSVGSKLRSKRAGQGAQRVAPEGCTWRNTRSGTLGACEDIRVGPTGGCFRSIPTSCLPAYPLSPFCAINFVTFSSTRLRKPPSSSHLTILIRHHYSLSISNSGHHRQNSVSVKYYRVQVLSLEQSFVSYENAKDTKNPLVPV